MKKIKVLIIDDSTVIRNVVREVLSFSDEIAVVGEAEDPIIARELIKKLSPDVLTLDVEMPNMDGITFLSNLMRLRPMPVVMLSTLTKQGAEITLKALELGAIDFIAKPSFEELVENKASFKDLLISKVRNAATIDNKNYQLKSSLLESDEIRTLAFNDCKRSNHLVAIGASTGGTEAIKNIITRLPSNAPPVVITLHIPEKFSKQFALRMNNICQVTVKEASHGQLIKIGHVYIAPGDKHLKVNSKSGSLYCTLEDSEPVNRHKPAVDVLFLSLIPLASNTQAILLTGMGQDGAQGLLELKEHGAFTMIQDKHSSLIWGMPGCAHQLNAHRKILPLDNIAKQILSIAALDRTGMKEIMNEN